MFFIKKEEQDKTKQWIVNMIHLFWSDVTDRARCRLQFAERLRNNLQLISK